MKRNFTLSLTFTLILTGCSGPQGESPPAPQAAGLLSSKPAGQDYWKLSGLWRAVGGKTELRHTVGWPAFESERQKLTGWQLIDLEVLGDQVAGLWRRPGADLAGLAELDRIHHDLDATSLAAAVADERPQGFELVDFEVSADGKTWHGVWYPQAPTHDLQTAIPPGSLEQLVVDEARQGRRAVDVETYRVNDQPVFAVLWSHGAGPDVVARKGGLAEFAAIDAELHQQGYRRRDLEQYYATPVRATDTLTSGQGGGRGGSPTKSVQHFVGLWEIGSGDQSWKSRFTSWQQLFDRDALLTGGDLDSLSSGPGLALVDLDLLAYGKGPPNEAMPLEHDDEPPPTTPPP
jgi:Polyglycine hydrolase-like, structural repeat